MAKTNLQNITTAQTFQNWFDKTNEVVGILKTDAITASGSGDTTTGDATLTGDFTATNLIADTLLQSDTIAPQTGGGTIQINGKTKVNGTSQDTLIISHGTGGQAQFTNGSITWDVGLKDSGGDFIINTGAGVDKLNLSTAGMLSVPNITVAENIVASGDVTANNFYGDGSNLTGVVSSVSVAGLSDVTITNVADGQILKYDSSAAAWVNDTDFDSGTNADTLDNLNSTQFLRSDANDTYTGDLTVTGAIIQTGNLSVDGALTVTGDITTNYSASDERLKENIQVIEQPLDKISDISGYTFNYKDKPEETVPGVIAQEVETILPGVVFDHERNGGIYKAVRYDQLIPLLIEGIKELKEKVNDLEDQLKS